MAVRIPNSPDQPGSDIAYPIQAVYDTWRYGAETPEELLGLLIDGYADQADEQTRLQARIQFAVHARGMVQTLLNAGEQFDFATAEEAHILHTRGDTPLAVAEWDCAVPLALITVFYQPIGQLPQPRVSAPGQVWWIDPSSAQPLLETLHQVRWLDLTVSGEAAAWRAESRPYSNLGTNGAAGYQWRRLRAGVT